MPQEGTAALFGIADGKLARLLTDTDAGVTYEAPLDIPGIQSIQFSPEFQEKELSGDDMVLDQYSKLKAVTGTVKHGKVSLAVLAVLMGGRITDEGVAPYQRRTLDVYGTSQPSYFSLEGQVRYKGGEAAGGDWHPVFWKCKVTKFQNEYQGEDYAIVSFDFRAVPRLHDALLVSLVDNETEVAILGVADAVPPTVTGVTPTDADVNVPVGANVVFTFSKALQTSTVAPGTFLLVKAVDGTIVPATITYSDVSHNVVVDPLADLDAATAYLAIASQGVRSAAGVPLAAASIVNFTTA